MPRSDRGESRLLDVLAAASSCLEPPPLFSILTVVVGAILLVVTSVTTTFVNADIIVPNVLVLMVVYASIHRDAFGSLVTAFLLGLAAGLMNAGGRGMLLFSLLPVIGLTRWARHSLQLSALWASVGWVIPMVLIADLTFALVAVIFAPDLVTFPSFIRISPASALVTGVMALPVFGVLRRVEPLLQERQEKSSIFR